MPRTRPVEGFVVAVAASASIGLATVAGVLGGGLGGCSKDPAPKPIVDAPPIPGSPGPGAPDPAAAPEAVGTVGSGTPPADATGAPPGDVVAEASRPGDNVCEGAVQRIYGTDVWPCSGHPVCAEPSPADGTLSLAQTGAEHIDPSLVTESAGMMIVENLFEGLLAFPPCGTTWESGVAERWELGADGKTWTFHLRKDARWSNGRAVTAGDFVYAWTRKLLPETGSESAEHHFYIRNAKPFHEGNLKDPAQLGFRAEGDHTLVVELEEETPFFLHYVKTGHYAPVPREAVEAHGKDWTRPEHIVTNGPYHLAEWKDRDRMVLVKSETYRDAAAVRIPKVVVFHSESQDDDFRRYESGQVQFTKWGLAVDKIPLALQEKRPDLVIDPYLAYYYYAFRMDRPPLDDVRVRRAIDMAIDKERLVRHVTNGLQRPADGPVPEFFVDSAGYPKPVGNPFDPEKAKQLLADAGFPGGVGLPPITLVYNTSEGHRAIAEFVQRSLKDNLGLSIAIENMEWKSLLKLLRTGEFQMARYGWIGIPDPYSFLTPFRKDSAQNVMGYDNPELDKLLDESLRTRDHDARMKVLAKAEAIVQADAPMTALYYYTRVYLKKPVLRGYNPELNDAHPFKHLWWADKETAK